MTPVDESLNTEATFVAKVRLAGGVHVVSLPHVVVKDMTLKVGERLNVSISTRRGGACS